MSDELLQVEAQKRDVFGKRVKARRRAGLIPANIIFKGRPSQAIEIPASQLAKVLHQVGYTQALELVIGEDKTTVLVTEVSFAPVGDSAQHVVFAEVKKGEKVHASVPLLLVGEAPGVQKGLMVLQMLHQLEVISPALQIPEQFEIDISTLEEDGDGIRVAAVEIPAGIETEVDLHTLIVRLEMSRSQVAQEEDEEDEEGEEEVEGSETESSESE